MPLLKFNTKNSLSAHAATETERQTIVSTEKSELTSSLLYDAKENQAPFDTENRKMMEGVSITPTADSKNQINNKEYSVNEFIINSDISIFMWIYFPDKPYDNFYDFYISFSNSENGKKIEWEFSYKELSNLMGLSLQNGWKQIELVFNDAKKSFTDRDDTILNRMQISYKKSNDLPSIDNEDLINSISTDTLTFYNVYASSKTPDGINEVTKSSIKKSLNYAYFAFKSNFTSQLRNVYVGNSYSLKGKNPSDIFSYVYVGKSNLLNGGSSVNRFTWEVSVSSKGDKSEVIDFNDTIYFDNIGTSRIAFKLEEQKQTQTKSELVFNAVLEVIVKKFAFGSFSEPSYNIVNGEKIIITFTLSEDYETENLVTFTSENEKIAKINSVNYNSETRTYHIEITAKKKGNVNIKASSTGKKINNSNLSGNENLENVSNFTENIAITIKSDGINQWMINMLYAILACFGLAFIIFLIISFVSARRNIVK